MKPNRPVSILRSIPSPASPYPHRSDFTIGTRCRPILHFIPREWVASRGARMILLDVTFPPCETLDLLLHPFHSDRKGLQMAAISACIDSWNWEDLLVSMELSHLQRFANSFARAWNKFLCQLACSFTNYSYLYKIAYYLLGMTSCA